MPRGRPRTTSWIDGEQGLGIRRYASGRGVHIVQTRMAGRLRTVTIGPDTIISRHQAVQVARRVIAHALVGADPASERERIRSAPCFDEFVEEYWQRWSPHWKPSSLRTNAKYRRIYIDNAFPGVFVDELSEADVTKWFADLNNRLGPGGVNRVFAMLNHIMNKAESWGYRVENTNPCRAVRRHRKRQCQRFLSCAELERLGEVLARKRSGQDMVRASAATAVALLLLTGCRVSEITGLQWQDVRGNRLKLRDSKVGPRTVWLGEEARALIDSLPRDRNNPCLFWNQRMGKPLHDIDYYWYEIRDEAGLSRVRLHDLRHTFASHAAMNKETLPMIGRLLGHSCI